MQIMDISSSINNNNNRPSPLKLSRDNRFPSFKSPRSPLPLLRASEDVQSVKCVLVGDSQVGKSALVSSFLFEEFCPSYIPTVRDDFTYCTNTPVTMNEESVVGLVKRTQRNVDVDLDIVDTGGEAYLDRLRPLCYGDGVNYNTDVAVICFSVVVPSSFHNVTRRWIPELKRHCLNFNKNMKTILVGTQSDLRSNVNILLQLMDDGHQSPISELRAMRLAKKIGAVKYLECSSFNGFNIKRVFETVINSGVRMSIIPTIPSSNGRGISGNSNKSKSSLKPLSQNNLAKAPVTTNTNSSISIPMVHQHNSEPKLFKRGWRLRQKSNKIKRLMFSCLH